MSTCPEYKKVFSCKEDMKRYFSAQHGKEEYNCITCGQVYFRKDELKQHMKNHEKLSTDFFNVPSTVTDRLSSQTMKVTLVSHSHRRYVELPAKPKPMKTAEKWQ